MFHMLTCFNLAPDTSLEEFRESLAAFSQHMEGLDLQQSAGPIGRRQSDTIMDTDDERDHQYFFITTFRDRAQCDLAVEYIRPPADSGEPSHISVLTKVTDPVFICWEDIQVTAE
jgi:hypothetical protein